MKNFLVAFCLMGFAAAAFGAEAKKDAELVEQLREAGAGVYALMDANDFEGFYTAFAAEQFREGVALDKWVQVAGDARGELGTNTSRVLIEIRKERVLFGEPKEEFYALLYESDYTTAKVYDRLVFTKEGDAWKVVGIWSVGRD